MGLFTRAMRIALWVVVTASLHPALAQETVELTPWTAAEFGGEGGDALSLERITRSGAVVLLNPHGEDCTLRFAMKIGEKVRLRGATIGDQQTVCEVLLVSATESPSAIFTYECLNQTPSAERRCPRQGRSD
jgi:hypothetical protein